MRIPLSVIPTHWLEDFPQFFISPAETLRLFEEDLQWAERSILEQREKAREEAESWAEHDRLQEENSAWDAEMADRETEHYFQQEEAWVNYAEAQTATIVAKEKRIADLTALEISDWMEDEYEPETDYHAISKARRARRRARNMDPKRRGNNRISLTEAQQRKLYELTGHCSNNLHMRDPDLTTILRDMMSHYKPGTLRKLARR